MDVPADGGRVDLHLHSTASDGTLPPAEVVARVAARGLVGLSLTDHDTVDGLDEAEREARRRGLAFLPGAELSAVEPGASVHILAFGFDRRDPALLEFLSAYRGDRERRAREIVTRLRRHDVPLTYADVREQAGGAAPTRAHLARALLARGLAKTHEEVFRRWLGRGRPAFVEKRPVPPAEVIRRVHAAGGVTALAHPGRVHGAPAIRRWAAEGLDGVEVRHPENAPDVRERLERLAAELGLLRTGGSDWHGPQAHRPEPGTEEVPLTWLERIAARCATGVYHPGGR